MSTRLYRVFNKGIFPVFIYAGSVREAKVIAMQRKLARKMTNLRAVDATQEMIACHGGASLKRLLATNPRGFGAKEVVGSKGTWFVY